MNLRLDSIKLAENVQEIKPRIFQTTHDMPGLSAYAQSPASTVLVVRNNAVSDRRSFILSEEGVNES